MPRHLNDDLIRNWKISLPATLAGSVEHLLFDPIHSRPIYAARGKLLEILLEIWLDKVQGRTPREIPTLEEIRNA